MEKAHFEFAADACKQILTFDTAILVLTVTFAKDTFVKDRQAVPWSLRLSWLCYLASIFCAVWTLAALTGEFAQRGALSSIYAPNVTIPAMGLIVSFLFGLTLTVIAAWRATSATRAVTPPPPPAVAGDDVEGAG